MLTAETLENVCACILAHDIESAGDRDRVEGCNVTRERIATIMDKICKGFEISAETRAKALGGMFRRWGLDS